MQPFDAADHLCGWCCHGWIEKAIANYLQGKAELVLTDKLIKQLQKFLGTREAGHRTSADLQLRLHVLVVLA